MFEVLLEFKWLFLKGFLTTLELLGMIMLVGIPLGMLIGVLGGRYVGPIAHAVRGLMFLKKVVPVLVLLFWLHYPLQALLGIVVDPFWTTVGALGLINLIGVAFIMQTELKLLPRAYMDAGITLGMSKRQVVQYIELPIMFRRIVPSVIANQAAMLEYTLLASLISVPELFRVAQTINSMIYDPVSVYSLLVFFFMIILIPTHLFVRYIEKRYVIQYV